MRSTNGSVQISVGMTGTMSEQNGQKNSSSNRNKKMPVNSCSPAMTAGAHMTDLIARLEAATGPSRELDALIWCAVNKKEFVCFDGMTAIRGNGFYHKRSGGSERYECRHIQYTSSIDAALRKGE